ncbi:MAG: 30S ribosomal protein S20 [Pseudomonadota bacterium]|nr:30S ribosomal protein S20 [Pseudomonadota bacterium]MEC8086502.1 30S ribosomal protein S20 [Pseudomonadota bacterium]MEC8462270.1 30S ribosomal protein S20 [Pseudomonadota bacterium]MEC8727071.1 30S ribosomal protein S20 [Pseudomonadota bacterium]
MANTSSAKKRIRRDERKSHINISRRSRIRTYIKRVEAAIEEGNKDAASAALKEAQPEMMRGVSRGVYKKNTAARKISRLSHRINKIQ